MHPFIIIKNPLYLFPYIWDKENIDSWYICFTFQNPIWRLCWRSDFFSTIQLQENQRV